MSNLKFNQTYIDAWTKEINNNNEQVVLIISVDDAGAVHLKTINNLGSDTLKHLFFKLHSEIEAQTFLQKIKVI